VASPKQQLLLVDSNGTQIDVDESIEKLRGDKERVLADDEVGLIIYVGDLDYYDLTPIETGEFLARPRYSGVAATLPGQHPA
jgi:hypothetical protein